MKNILIAFAILAAVALISGIALLVHVSRDIPAPDVSDLSVDFPEMAPDDNACTYYLLATNTLYQLTNCVMVTDYLDGKEVDLDIIEDLITKNENMESFINRGNACSRCITPGISTFDDQLPYISNWMSISRILAAKTRYSRLKGDFADATGTCISLIKFGNRVQQDAGSLINYLVGIAILQKGLAQAQDLARDPRTPSDELMQLSDTLTDIGPFDPGLILAIKVEYKVVANTLDQIRNGTFNTAELFSLGGENSKFTPKRIPSYLFQPNSTKLTIANLYRDIINDAPLTFAEMKCIDTEPPLTEKRDMFKLMLSPNVIGNILYSLLKPSTTSLLERKCRIETELEATRILVAIARFRAEHDNLPPDLSSLVPEYFSAIPVDPFDGAPFRYAQDKGILYSVGSDLMDSGGYSQNPMLDKGCHPAVHRWNSEDAVFEINERIKGSL